MSRDFLSSIDGQSLGSGLANYFLHVTNLFAVLSNHAQAAAFAQNGLQHSSPRSSPLEHTDLLSRLFHASLATHSFTKAYSALVRYTDRALQGSALAQLVSTMAAHGAIDELLRFPFPTLRKELDTWLHARSVGEADTPLRPGQIPHYKILYAWRLRQGDFRGAAQVLVERLEAKKSNARASGGLGKGDAQKEAEKALDEYLVGINALALVGGEEDGWVFVKGGDDKRKVVRLADLREQYDKEMDRVGMLELGRFGIVGDEDDEDVEMS
jgi:nuclear pore complex protein Nup160